jgi:hypothetical protein
MSDMDKEIAEKTDEAREQVQAVLAIATGMSTMLIEELDKNPQLIENLKTIGDKYADLIVSIAKPIVDYTKAEELKLCQAKFDLVESIYTKRTEHSPSEQELVMLLAACFSRS